MPVCRSVDSGKGAPVHKGKGADRKTEYVDSCASLARWSEHGYSALANVYLKFLHYQEATCRIIELLRSAKPARTSFVREFALDGDALDYLPDMVNLSPSCEGAGWQFQANEKSIPLTQHSEISELQVVGSNRIEFDTDGDFTSVEAMARADFNGDGLVLRVLDAAKELCRDYDYPFDHPEPGG